MINTFEDSIEFAMKAGETGPDKLFALFAVDLTTVDERILPPVLIRQAAWLGLVVFWHECGCPWGFQPAAKMPFALVNPREYLQMDRSKSRCVTAVPLYCSRVFCISDYCTVCIPSIFVGAVEVVSSLDVEETGVNGRRPVTAGLEATRLV